MDWVAGGSFFFAFDPPSLCFVVLAADLGECSSFLNRWIAQGGKAVAGSLVSFPFGLAGLVGGLLAGWLAGWPALRDLILLPDDLFAGGSGSAAPSSHTSFSLIFLFPLLSPSGMFWAALLLCFAALSSPLRPAGGSAPGPVTGARPEAAS